MYILTITAPDSPGIVAAVASALSEANCNIEDSAQFHDPHCEQFFMRIVLRPLTEGAKDTFTEHFPATAAQYAMNWNITRQDEAVKTLILVSKQDHCLNDILYRTRTQSLNIDIKAIASNHETTRSLAEIRSIPFHHFSITPETKADQEQHIRDLIDETGAELIIMARYMQILSNEFCEDFKGRVINIHHSFLPSFKGARPYEQAYNRGVKMIGATAHFATADLDEGPIITQAAQPVTHAHTPGDMQTLGRDTEARALAEAINLYSQRRIFMHTNRTIIL